MAEFTRRALLAAPATMSLAATAPSDRMAEAVERHDEAVPRYLKLQTIDPDSRWHGAPADAYGLHHGSSCGSFLEVLVTAFTQPKSRFHRDRDVLERIRLGAAALARMQTAGGNFNLLTTNYNSPPDTAFVLRSAVSAYRHAREAGEREILRWLEPTLLKGGSGLVHGGMHTPNHRWVACAALAQLNEVLPNPDYVRRIDQWLAEAIDIDADGQYAERSTLVYNHITNSALIAMAEKLKRPELLVPVRRNLEAMLYLLHPGDEVVTEISRRQDKYQRGKPQSAWFALRYMARQENDGRFATLESRLNPSLSQLMEYPLLRQPGPAPLPLPDDYARLAPSGSFAHIRRGETSVTMMMSGDSRFLTMRRGGAVVEAVRMAWAFFGKGQLVPQRGGRSGEAWLWEQDLDAGYWQPFDTPRVVPPGVDSWYKLRAERKRTEVCQMRYQAVGEETAKGFRLRLRAGGTADVPVAVELHLCDGGKLEGCSPAPAAPPDAFVLTKGYATFTVGGDSIRFGPGLREHGYTQLRGALPKLPGPSVYLCGYAPFDHTVEFELR